MKRLLICILTVMVCLAPMASCATGVDYTIAEKLFRQIEAGSGFRGTLTLEIAAPDGGSSTVTNKPVELDVSYISVKPNALTGATGEKRLALTIPGEDKSLAELSVMQSRVAFTGKGLEDKWYALGESREGAVAMAAGTALEDTPMPALLKFIAPIVLLGSGDGIDLSAALDPYLTKLDLWLEGYRQSAQMGRLEDGTSTMEVSYQIPPQAIKAQLKQLIMDVLSDGELLGVLGGFLSDSDAALMLNPSLQDFYFSAVDALDLSDMMLVDRSYTLTGETLNLSITLPLYDSASGDVAVKYERTTGEGEDDPDTEKLTLESEKQSLSISYQAYQSMTGTSVYQGSLQKLALGDAAIGKKPLAIGFTLTHKQTQYISDDGKDALTHDIEFSLRQEAMEGEDTEPVTPVDVSAAITFQGRNANNAATEMDLRATITSEEFPQTITVSLKGKTAAPWSITQIPDNKVTKLASLSEAASDKALSAAIADGASTLLTYLTLGEDVKDIIRPLFDK